MQYENNKSDPSPPAPDESSLSTLAAQVGDAEPRAYRIWEAPSADDRSASQKLIDSLDDEHEDNDPWASPLATCETPVLQIIDPKRAQAALMTRLSATSLSDNQRINRLSRLFQERGSTRKLATIPEEWRAKLDALERSFPNFSKVVDFIRGSCAIAAYGNGVPKIGPILLSGPPGVGKTCFALALAEWLGAGFQTIHVETAQTSSGLSGSAEHWGNTKPGAVFNALVEGDYANPVFFLDEIDKAFRGEHDPLMSLYSLLEPVTAVEFIDASYPWLPGIDASRIVWICTCNEVARVPVPVLDRLHRFDVLAPTASQAEKIVDEIVRMMLADLPARLSDILVSSGAKKRLRALSPREIRKRLGAAIGRAVYRGRRRVLAGDVECTDEKHNASGRIGFLP